MRNIIALSLLFLFSFAIPVHAAANKPPTATSQSLVTNEDTALVITLSGTDPEGSSLTYRIVSAPIKGSVSCSGSRCTYTPYLNKYGYDFFTFKVNDGVQDSYAAARVGITITSVNDAPTVSGVSGAVAEDGSLVLRPTMADVDGDALTLQIKTDPLSGAATVSSTVLNYVPKTNFNGSDSFKYIVSDGKTTSSEATADITVTPVNDAPTAANQNVVTSEDVVTQIPLAVSDVDGNTLSVVFGYKSAHGTVTVPSQVGSSVPVVTYTPDSNYFGSDSFTYRVTDGSAYSGTATVTIDVVSANDRPSIADLSFVVGAGATAVMPLTATDIEDTVFTYRVVASPAFGQVSISDANLSYTAHANTSGTDVFSIVAIDSEGLESAAGTVTVSVVKSDTITPIHLNDLEQIPGVTTVYEQNKKIVTFAQHSCYEYIAQPLVVPVNMNGTVVQATAGMLHNRCLNTLPLEGYGFLVLPDGTAWKFKNETVLDLQPNAKATGIFDPILGTLQYPLVSTKNDDPNAPTGGIITYDHGQVTYIDPFKGRLIDTAILLFDGLFNASTWNPGIATCQRTHKIDAENCGVWAFLNQRTHEVVDRAYYTDNGYEAWYTAAQTRVKVTKNGSVVKDLIAWGTGPGGNAVDEQVSAGGCSAWIHDATSLRTALLNGEMKEENLFAHRVDFGDPGCVNINNSGDAMVLAGSALQGEATIGFNPLTKNPTFWFKAFQSDVADGEDTRISQLDEDGALVCETFVRAGSGKNPFHGVGTGIVIDHQGNAYTNADTIDESGVTRSSIIAIDPMSCMQRLIQDAPVTGTEDTWSGVTLAKDQHGSVYVLGVRNGYLHVINTENGADALYELGSPGSQSVAAAPTVDDEGNVVVITEGNILIRFDQPTFGAIQLASRDLFWPRFRQNNWGTGTVTINQ